MQTSDIVLIILFAMLASGLIASRDLLAGYVRERRFPTVAVLVFAITVIVTGIQLVYPPLLRGLWRDPDALAAGQSWRIITPLFVHSDGWVQIAFDFVALALVGTIANWLFGNWRWLLMWLGGGLLGEIAGYGWQPYAAGSSVGFCGLAGGLFIWLMMQRGRRQAQIAAGLGLIAAIVLTLMHDIHGPATLAGALIAIVTVRQSPDVASADML